MTASSSAALRRVMGDLKAAPGGVAAFAVLPYFRAQDFAEVRGSVARGYNFICRMFARQIALPVIMAAVARIASTPAGPDKVNPCEIRPSR